jgi:hypothetical protein
LRAALVEAEDFVIKVEAGGDEAEAVALRIDLDVGVEVDVAERTVDSSRRAILILVALDAGLVVGNAHPQGVAPVIVSRADVEHVGRIAQ